MSLGAEERPPTMATFVLIPGAGSDSWYWHLVVPLLAAAGHDVVAVDLPCEDDSAGLEEYVEAVLTAIGDRTDLVLVAQSMGGFTAPIVATRVPVDLIVLVAAMVPLAGEAPGEWWEATGLAQDSRAFALEEGRDPGAFDVLVTFFHDVPPSVVDEAGAHELQQSGTPGEKPWPLDAWPDVPTRFLLCRHDRMFPPAFQRRIVRDRLGIVPDEMDGGHLPALARPEELAARLLAYLASAGTLRGTPRDMKH
jgi:pimeloyl-ACP methyl ester carboxylesterase